MVRQTVHNQELATDTARMNLLVNGGFEIWQRGTSFPFTGPVWLADRWLARSLGANSTGTISQNTANAQPRSRYCMSVAFTAGTGSQGDNATAGGIFARFMPGDMYELIVGQQLTLSARVLTSTANAVRLCMLGGAVNTSLASGAYHSGSGQYETLTMTFVVPTGQTSVDIGFEFMATCQAYLDNAMLVFGNQPADYIPMHVADDLARCLRYYNKLGAVTGGLGYSAYGAAGNNVWQWYELPKMAVTPTVTKVGTWAVSNIPQPAVSAPCIDGFQLYNAPTATGAFYWICGDTTNYITAEANP